ncbi:solute carrier organic anion transporter family member 5A1b [Neosynchiropus ocellatus]
MNHLCVRLLLLAACRSVFCGSSERRVGCLFEKQLCSSYEICVNDGMFGRCHAVPVKEVYTYDVSLPVVQHFRLLLEKLSHSGLTWRDDTTQQVLSQELSKLRRVSHRLPQNRPVYRTDSRLVAMDPVDQQVKPVEEELGRNLQMYLQRLGLLPKPPGSAVSSADEGARLHSTDYPGSRASGPARLRQRPLNQDDMLLNLLRKFLSQQTSLDTGPPAPSQLRPRPEDGGKSRTFNAGRTQSKDPLTYVDERFIQNVLKNVGRQHLDLDTLTPHDVDQLSRLITDALQVVDRDQESTGAQFRPGPRDLGEQDRPQEGHRDAVEGTEEAPTVLQQQSAESPEAPKERSPDSGALDVSVKPGSGSLFTKLLAYLDNAPFTTPSSPQMDRVTSAVRQVGLENVQSRTSAASARVQKKDATQSVEEVSEVEGWIKEVAPPPALLLNTQLHKKTLHVPELQLDVKKADDDVFGYVITDTDRLQTDEGLNLMKILAGMSKIHMTDFSQLSVVGPAVTFKVSPNTPNVSTADVANVAVRQKASLEKEAKVVILEAGVADGSQIDQIPGKYNQAESTKFLILTVVSILCIVGVLLASTVVYCFRHRSHHKLKEKLTNLGTESSGDSTATYQDLCRQRMAVKPPAERTEPLSSRINSVSSQFSDAGAAVSPSARSSVSSWSEEPAHSHLDISTGHMILSYMEDHLKNKDRLEKEWEALCAYQAEPNACTVGLKDGNAKKNRSAAVVAYDHSRITLKSEHSHESAKYINASPIMDHDPRNPAYIATQGPLPSTVADFWQMVWENGCVVIVMLTPVVESGVKQCYHYWPDEGSNLYHIYEVNLVSEHIWCDDFLVRSFYLKNMQTNETRTVTQFHYLTWLSQSVPESSRSLLDFRRKVNKCYRGRSCPVIVHCSEGAGRTGTYILVDMVLNKMAKGAKEIDIAATLEHLRDQRPGMVQSKDQFEFALTAVAEEVNAILKALPQ